ncbi:hypothetical protein Q5752_002496 [Cryptotrichosporon argae]
MPWSPPPQLVVSPVLPDRRSTLDQIVGHEADPSKTGIFLCLLDDRPCLFPTMAALNSHRTKVHALGPAVEGPEWTGWRAA